MFKRLFLIVALGAAIAACSPSGGSSTSPGIDDGASPSEMAPTLVPESPMGGSPAAS